MFILKRCSRWIMSLECQSLTVHMCRYVYASSEYWTSVSIYSYKLSVFQFQLRNRVRWWQTRNINLKRIGIKMGSASSATIPPACLGRSFTQSEQIHWSCREAMQASRVWSSVRAQDTCAALLINSSRFVRWFIYLPKMAFSNWNKERIQSRMVHHGVRIWSRWCHDICCVRKSDS